MGSGGVCLVTAGLESAPWVPVRAVRPRLAGGGRGPEADRRGGGVRRDPAGRSRSPHPTPGAALTPRAGCRWSRGRCRCPPAAPPSSPASSAPAGRSGSTAQPRSGPRRCSCWSTWWAATSGPRRCCRRCHCHCSLPSPGPSSVAANGHAPTCQFEFPTSVFHWARQDLPLHLTSGDQRQGPPSPCRPLEEMSGTTPSAWLLAEAHALPCFHWSRQQPLCMARPAPAQSLGPRLLCSAGPRPLHPGGAGLRLPGGGKGGVGPAQRWSRLVGHSARLCCPALSVDWAVCGAGRGGGGPVRGTGRRVPAAGGRPAAGGGEAAPQRPGNRPARPPGPLPSSASPLGGRGQPPTASPAVSPQRGPEAGRGAASLSPGPPPPGPPHASSPRRPHCSSRAGCGSGGCRVYLFLPPVRASSAGAAASPPPSPGKKRGEKFKKREKSCVPPFPRGQVPACPAHAGLRAALTHAPARRKNPK